MRDGNLQEAMRRLSITDLWKKRGWAGSPNKSCHFPGEDRDRRSKASCSIFVATTGRHTGFQLLKNHREGKTYDGPELLCAVEGVSNQEACRIFIDLAGVKPLDTPPGVNSGRRSAPAVKRAAPPREEPPKPPLFDFRVLGPHNLDADEVEAIATTRGISARAVESVMRWDVIHAVALSSSLKLPLPHQAMPMKAWALHTPDWQSLRLRAFCGVFHGFGDQTFKSLTPAGAGCGHPVWIGPANAPHVLVVEGEADGLAAFEIARRENVSDSLAIAVIFSSSISIPSSFLPRLEGRRVRIIPHVGDKARQGERAACQWAATVKPWVEAVEIYSLAGLVLPDGRAVTDLGDLAQLPDSTLNGLKGVTTW